MKKLKLLTAVLLIASLLLSIAPQTFASTFNWLTNDSITFDYVYRCQSIGAIVEKDEKVAFINSKGETVIPFEKNYERLVFLSGDGDYIGFGDSSNMGILDLNGNVVVKARKNHTIDGVIGDSFYYGYYKDRNDNTKSMIADFKGNIIWECERYIGYTFYDIFPIAPGFISNGSGVYTTSGEAVIPSGEYSRITATDSPYRFVAQKDGNTYLFDNAWQIVASFPGTIHSCKGDYIVTEIQDRTKNIYDLNGVYAGSLAENQTVYNGKFICNEDNKMVSDFRGNVIIPANTYEYVETCYQSDEILKVRNNNGDVGLINKNGEIVLPIGKIADKYPSVYDNKYTVYDVKSDWGITIKTILADIYGNTIAEFDNDIYWLYDNGLVAVTEHHPEGSKIRFGKVEGEPIKPAAPEATPAVTVTVNGYPVQFPDQAPVIIDGRTLLPLRAVFELMSASIDWNGETQTVTSTRGDKTISLAIGSNQLFVNGEAKTLDVPAQIMNGRTMVPVRAVADAFGCDIDWDSSSYTVTITIK